MEYYRGIRITQHLHEMSPLERAIADFETKAKQYYDTYHHPSTDKAPEQVKTREKASREAFKHLNQERLKALTIVSIQSELQAYRDAYRPENGASRHERKEMRSLMVSEKHHPTTLLAKFLRADGKPQPDRNFTAHHIVQGKGKTEKTAKARIELHFHGVRINDPDNGMWLPRHRKDKGHWAMPHAPAHSEIHTHNYETWVNGYMQGVTGEAMLRSRLMHIRNQLRDGNQPPLVTQKPDPNWDGKS